MSEESLELSSDEVQVAKDNIATPEESVDEESYLTESVEDEEEEEEPEPEKKVEEVYLTNNGQRKSKKQLEKERAFKKTDFAESDPILLDHRTERRALAKKLEEDPEFRAAYIAREERLRLQREEEEMYESSSISDADINDVIRTVHKMQGNYLSDEDNEEVDVMAGVSDDGYVDISHDSSSWGSSEKKKKKKNRKKKGRKGTRRIGINIENLVIENLVLNL